MKQRFSLLKNGLSFWETVVNTTIYLQGNYLLRNNKENPILFSMKNLDHQCEGIEESNQGYHRNKEKKTTGKLLEVKSVQLQAT